MSVEGATSKVHAQFASKVPAGLCVRCTRARAGTDDSLAVFGGRRRWRVERPQSSFLSRQPSRGFRRVAALASGASREFLS